MFHHERDASKVALAALVDQLRARQFTLLDVQWVTPHLETFGAIEIPRRRYLAVSRTRFFSIDRFEAGARGLLGPVSGPCKARSSELGDACIEAVAVACHHLIRPFHRPERRPERAAGGVLERLARREHRLFADDAVAADLFDVTVAVGDDPVAGHQPNLDHLRSRS